VTEPVIIERDRTVVLQVELWADLTASSFASEIRAEIATDSALIATWTIVESTTINSEGDTVTLLTLTLDNTTTAAITADEGWMDIKRTASSEPFKVFDNPIPVQFRGSVTA
jgi:hypothetical protein